MADEETKTEDAPVDNIHTARAAGAKQYSDKVSQATRIYDSPELETARRQGWLGAAHVLTSTPAQRQTAIQVNENEARRQLGERNAARQLALAMEHHENNLRAAALKDHMASLGEGGVRPIRADEDKAMKLRGEQNFMGTITVSGKAETAPEPSPEPPQPEPESHE